MKVLTIPIGDSTLFISDGNYSSKYPKKEEFIENGVPFVSSNNLKDGRIVWENMKYISPQQHATLKKGHLKNKDVLLVTRGNTIGATAFVTCRFAGANINAQLVLLRADNTVIDPAYLYFFVSSETFFKNVQSFSSGTAQPQLPIGALKRMPLSLPPITTQRKIAGVLSAYDDLIENNTRRIAILEEMAQAIYREWFVNFRFPGHEKVKLINSPLGKIPEGWAIRPFTDIADILSGGTPKTTNESYWNGDIPFFTPKDCPDGFFVLNTERSITTEGLVNCASSLFPPRTVFITARGTVGKTVLIPEPMAMSQSCYAIAGKEYSQSFILMTLRRYIEELKKKSHGAVFDTIIKDTFIQLKVLCPLASVVTRFCNITSPLFDQILALSKKNQVLRRTRDLLLPKLISGQLDVEELDIETGESLVEAEA